MKKPAKRIKPISRRLIVLPCFCLLAGVLLWLARFARYRYQYVFRDFLPVILPAFAGAVLIAWIVLLILRLRGKSGGAVFSTDFLLFLLGELFLVPALPCLTLFSPIPILFRIVSFLTLLLICGGAISYALWHLRAKPLGAFAGAVTLDLAAFLFYDRLYTDPAAAILSTARGFPAENTAVIGSGVFLLVIFLALFLAGKKNAAVFGMPFRRVFLSAAIAFSGILLCRFLPALSYIWRWAIPGILILTAIFFALFRPKK